MIKNPLPFLRQLALPDMEVGFDTPGGFDELNRPDYSTRETLEEIQARLEGARLAFLALPEKPEWFGEYEELIEAGWGHRVSVYIAWASTPKKRRMPKTMGEVASLLGLNSPRQIYQWRKENPVIDETVTLMQAAPLFAHRADVIRALVESASTDDYKNAPDRRIFFNLTGDLDESTLKVKRAATDLSDLSDEELAALEAELLGGKVSGVKGQVSGEEESHVE